MSKISKLATLMVAAAFPVAGSGAGPSVTVENTPLPVSVTNRSLSVTADGNLPVTVQNGAANPLPVKVDTSTAPLSVQPTARVAFIARIQASIAEGSRSAYASRSVTTTKRMVIEQINGTCSWPDGQLVRASLGVYMASNDPLIAGDWLSIDLPMTVLPAFPYLSGPAQLGVFGPALTRIYADPTSAHFAPPNSVQFQLEMVRDNDVGDVSCIVQMVGHYEDSGGTVTGR